MRLGETATIGRVGGKAMVWFITSSILSILVGLVIVTIEHPGAGLNLAIPKESVDTGLAVSGMSLKGFLSHTIPTSITEAMANNEILQIVVFSMFFGIAGASLGKIQRAAGRGAERRLAYHAEGHRICDVRGAVGDFCRDLVGYRLAGDGHSA
jgi:Na+/H+-dicarboxylate symporter